MESVTIHEMAARSVQARARIGRHIYKTPLIASRNSSNSHKGRHGEAKNAHLLFKAENFQYTGSFKFRGAMAKLSASTLAIPKEPVANRMITSSSGNHGIAAAQAATMLHKKLTIVLPSNVVAAKLEKIRSFPVDVILQGEESGEAEQIARQRSENEGCPYISPYNDPDIIAGQGTIGLELLEQCDAIDNVFIAMGGGGLVSGIACVLKAFSPQTRIYGVAAKNSNALAQSMIAGKVIDIPHKPTLADGVAGGIDNDTLTLPLAMTTLDKVLECEEKEIENALYQLVKQENMLVEGSAALALAGFNQVKEQCCGQTSIVVLCGANFDRALLGSMIRNV